MCVIEYLYKCLIRDWWATSGCFKKLVTVTKLYPFCQVAFIKLRILGAFLVKTLSVTYCIHSQTFDKLLCLKSVLLEF